MSMKKRDGVYLVPEKAGGERDGNVPLPLSDFVECYEFFVFT